MPRFSTSSVVVRIPAVSINLNVTPSITMLSSIESRVVPCTSDTIALSSLSRLLSSVDLPTFVLPTNATGTPFFMTLPILKESTSSAIRRSILSARALSSSRSANSTSSSEKSSSSSMSDTKFSSCSRNRASSAEKPPLICRIAI